MKKIFSTLMIALVALTSASFVSCSKDDDNNGSNNIDYSKEQSLDKSEWEKNLAGTWKYDINQKSVRTGETYGTSGLNYRWGTETFNEHNSLTLGGGVGTYSYSYDSKTVWDNGSEPSANNVSYTIEFKYDFKLEQATFYSAYVEATVTKTNNPDYYEVGKKITFYISNMTKNTVSLDHSDNVSKPTYIRQ